MAVYASIEKVRAFLRRHRILCLFSFGNHPMMNGRPNVPAVDVVVGPGRFLLGLCLVGSDFCAKGCLGSLVEVKVAKKLVVCG